MNATKSIEVLQFFTTGLNAQSFAHRVQGKVFGSLGFSKLATKYADHASEELGYVDQFMQRILDLGGQVKIEATQPEQVVENPIEYIKNDCQVSVDGIELLRQKMEEVKEDVTTYDILKVYLKDEEEDLYWSQEQIGLINCIGEQNWLIRQL
ncbi:bacterioferritin [Prevotella sp. kh1p2]|uniref:ferritin-like domain-containing protein n=1 Tax=Prevotella sp. kh1p2 TaxID=1761883 RepID=UPI0008D1B80F|nr:ferritin-like domain-containing protein [Prevotella sp. kh1p2]SES74410.1 bacterioferritin [Prevotella sp. kh1p2]SNU10565.1 bacterioferritin [Prevotellaceae bacterium KH2P17]